MKIITTKIPEVLILEPTRFGDERGFFQELWRAQAYQQAGIKWDFVQDNVSYSTRGVLRGLHYQNPYMQGKLVSVIQGEVFDVAVDIRKDSATFGQWIGANLSEENHRQLWIPPGFAHGFCVVSDHAYFTYKCTDIYNPKTEGGIAWNDSDIGIQWPLVEVQLSAKDREYPRLKEIAMARLPSREL